MKKNKRLLVARRDPILGSGHLRTRTDPRQDPGRIQQDRGYRDLDTWGPGQTPDRYHTGIPSGIQAKPEHNSRYRGVDLRRSSELPQASRNATSVSTRSSVTPCTRQIKVDTAQLHCTCIATVHRFSLAAAAEPSLPPPPNTQRGHFSHAVALFAKGRITYCNIVIFTKYTTGTVCMCQIRMMMCRTLNRNDH